MYLDTRLGKSVSTVISGLYCIFNQAQKKTFRNFIIVEIEIILKILFVTLVSNIEVHIISKVTCYIMCVANKDLLHLLLHLKATWRIGGGQEKVRLTISACRKRNLFFCC